MGFQHSTLCFFVSKLIPPTSKVEICWKNPRWYFFVGKIQGGFFLLEKSKVEISRQKNHAKAHQIQPAYRWSTSTRSGNGCLPRDGLVISTGFFSGGVGVWILPPKFRRSTKNTKKKKVTSFFQSTQFFFARIDFGPSNPVMLSQVLIDMHD